MASSTDLSNNRLEMEPDSLITNWGSSFISSSYPTAPCKLQIVTPSPNPSVGNPLTNGVVNWSSLIEKDCGINLGRSYLSVTFGVGNRQLNGGALTGLTYNQLKYLHITHNPFRLWHTGNFYLSSNLLESINEIGIISDCRLAYACNAEHNNSDMFITPIDNDVNGTCAYLQTNANATGGLMNYLDDTCSVYNILRVSDRATAIPPTSSTALATTSSSQLVMTEPVKAWVRNQQFVKLDDLGAGSLGFRSWLNPQTGNPLVNTNPEWEQDYTTLVGGDANQVNYITKRLPLSYLFGFCNSPATHMIPSTLLQVQLTKAGVGEFVHSLNTVQSGFDKVNVDIVKCNLHLYYYNLTSDSAAMLNTDKTFLIDHWSASTQPLSESNDRVASSYNIQLYSGVSAIYLAMRHASAPNCQYPCAYQSVTIQCIYKGQQIPLQQQTVSHKLRMSNLGNVTYNMGAGYAYDFDDNGVYEVYSQQKGNQFQGACAGDAQPSCAYNQLTWLRSNFWTVVPMTTNDSMSVDSTAGPMQINVNCGSIVYRKNGDNSLVVPTNRTSIVICTKRQNLVKYQASGRQYVLLSGGSS